MKMRFGGVEKRYLSMVALVASVACSDSALAYAERAAGWKVSDADSMCVAAIEPKGSGATRLEFIKDPDGRGVVLVMTNPAWRATKDGFYHLSVALDSQFWSGGAATGTDRGDQRRGYTYGLIGAEAEAHFAKASTLSIFLDDRLIDRLPLSGSAAAVASVTRCLDEARRVAGAQQNLLQRLTGNRMDPLAYGFGQTGSANPIPRGNPRSWVTNADYPGRALGQNRSGEVHYTLTVSTIGRVLSCRVTATSGSIDLDEASCKNIARRARFQPARDKTGRAIVGEYTDKVIWEMPGPAKAPPWKWQHQGANSDAKRSGSARAGYVRVRQ
jgi:TonB family protein